MVGQDSTKVLRRVKGDLVDAGLAEWRNADHHSQGLTLSRSGLAVFLAHDARTHEQIAEIAPDEGEEGGA